MIITQILLISRIITISENVNRKFNGIKISPTLNFMKEAY
jgi:hypothetical protein